MAVVELGMNHAGEIRRLVGLAEPDVRVWTNVGDAHLGHFESAEGIADAKAEIFEGAAASSLLVANGDDARVMARLPRFAGRVVTFGFGATATSARTTWKTWAWRARARVSSRRAAISRVALPLVGRGNLLNVLAAAAVALEFDVPLETIVARAATLRPAAHRGAVVRLKQGITLVDDCYNSSPSALRRSLEAVARDTRHQRRVAVLGEMLELGRFSETLHRESGAGVGESGIDALVVVGGAPAGELAAAARAAGVADVRHVATSHEAVAALPRRAARRRPGAREGVARHRARHGGRPPHRGVALMLYHLLFPLHDAFSVLNVTRYITFRTAAASLTALALSLLLGPVDDPAAAGVPDRAGDPARGARVAPGEGRHAHDGWLAHPHVRADAHAAVGRPGERLHLDRGHRHGLLRRDRVRRRLPEAHAAVAPRAAAALQDGAAGARRRGRRPLRSSRSRSTTCTARA
jgi:hypothetical protein